MRLVVVDNKPQAISHAFEQLSINPELRAAATLGEGGDLRPEYGLLKYTKSGPLKGSALYDRALCFEDRISGGMSDINEYVSARRVQLHSLPDDSIKLNAIKELAAIIQFYRELKSHGRSYLETIDAAQDLQTSTDPLIRRGACHRLAGIDNPDILRMFYEIGLRDPYWEVRVISAHALQGTADVGAIKALCEVGLKDQDWRVVHESIESLKQTENPDALKALCQVMLHDGGTAVAVGYYAAEAIQGSTHQPTLTWLYKIGLTSQHAGLRINSAFALKGTTDQKAIEALFDTLTDPHLRAREHAALSLEVSFKNISDSALKDKIANALRKRVEEEK